MDYGRSFSMDRYFFPYITVMFLVLLTVFCGCTSTPLQNAATSPSGTSEPAVTATTQLTGTTALEHPAAKTSIAEQLAAVKSDNSIWREAYRMFLNMKSTEYVHPPYTVDDAAGIYEFDCLGFVDHVLMNADSSAYKEIGKNVNPSIESYAGYFNKLDTKTPDSAGWTKVAHPLDLKPGDVCLWLQPTTLDNGHMWIIAGTPSVNPKRGDEVLVRIFDASVAHSDDSRTGSAYKTGLGSGILGMRVDGNGNPIGLYWEGGVSTAAGERGSTIVCGRLNH
jgi:hypothetical protein